MSSRYEVMKLVATTEVEAICECIVSPYSNRFIGQIYHFPKFNLMRDAIVTTDNLKTLLVLFNEKT